MNYGVSCLKCGWKGQRKTLKNVDTAHVCCPGCGLDRFLQDDPDAAEQARSSVKIDQQ